MSHITRIAHRKGTGLLYPKPAHMRPRPPRARLALAEALLSTILDNADLIAEREVADVDRRKATPSAFLLVHLPAKVYDRLVAFGADIEDAEDDDPAGDAIEDENHDDDDPAGGNCEDEGEVVNEDGDYPPLAPISTPHQSVAVPPRHKGNAMWPAVEVLPPTVAPEPKILEVTSKRRMQHYVPDAIFPGGKRDPDAYIAETEGHCLYPHIQSGDKALISPAQPLAAGQFVHLKFRDGRQSMVKRLVQVPLFMPHEVKCGGGARIPVFVEMLNPQRDLIFYVDELEAIHALIAIQKPNKETVLLPVEPPKRQPIGAGMIDQFLMMAAAGRPL